LKKVIKPVVATLVGKPMEGLPDVRRGGLLKEFKRSVVPDDAQQSLAAFRDFFRAQFNARVRDPLRDKFGEFLSRKGEVALYSK
jgi:hypothetical protein